MTQMPAVLLFGGRSAERLVSVASAQYVCTAFPSTTKLLFIGGDGAIYRVTREELQAHQQAFEKPLQPKSEPLAPRIEAALGEIRGHVLFNALHGTEGEDGNLQALFERERIPFTGSGSHASRVCFNKARTKAALRGSGVQLAAELEFRAGKEKQSQVAAFLAEHKKIALKPNANGSSVGLFIVSNDTELRDAFAKMEAGADYMAEAFITGRELTVGVAQWGENLEALPPSEVLLAQGHSFDYQGKYLGRGTKEITPAELSAMETRACQALALEAHKRLGCRGYSRTDMILRDGKPVFLELNTLPGLTKSSFIPQQLRAAKHDLKEFVEEQLLIAQKAL